MLWRVGLGLPAAAVSAICYGIATVLQARAARSSTAYRHVDPRLLIRLARQATYLLGIGINLVGFAFTVIALRRLPLYVVQAITSANLAVTALLIAAFYRVRLARREWAAIATVCVGLALLALSSGHQGTSGDGLAPRIGLLAGAAALSGIAVALARTDRTVPSVLLGAVAGLAFGTVSIAARMAPTINPAHLAADPAAYAMAIAALVGALFFATALQRGRVTVVTATVVVSETVVPAIVGLVVLGDRIEWGATPVVVVGFVLSVGALLSLARFGDIPESATRDALANAP